MAKSTSVYVCCHCGHQAPSWMGQCPGCGEWDALVEEARNSGPAAKRASVEPKSPALLRDVDFEQVDRIATGSPEFDRVLGGGVVPGSLVLIGGAPGIGKSTLLNQTLGTVGQSDRRVLYISGEESAGQVRLRAERIGPSALQVPVLAETSAERIVATVEQERPDLCVIDSIQSLRSEALSSAPGTVAQVREATAMLTRVAKERLCAMFLVGHVTKDGALAGPRVLEHMVDCVLQFEGDRQRTHRILRAYKNRFGSAQELTVFEMSATGLTEVADASALFVDQSTCAPGSCLLAAMEGSRPLLVEVQALVSPTEIVPPRRVAHGIDRNRLSLILAVLGRHGGIALGGSDVFVNLVGGLQISEPGADLAVALALASAQRDRPLLTPGPDGEPRPLVAFGELGLTGELRYVAGSDRRLDEAAKFGVPAAVTPEGSEGVGIEVRSCSTLRAALAAALSSDEADLSRYAVSSNV